MTATVNSVIATAKSQLGYVEGGGPDGHSGNITKYWTELAPSLQGNPWCACFQRWVDIHAGGPDLPVSSPYYCPSLVTYAKQHGLWLNHDQGSPGDFVFFSWNKNGVADHVGRVIAKGTGSYETIEGNTSEGTAGSQSNGGGVYQRTRPDDGTILGFLDYSKLLEHVTSTGTAPRNPVKANPYAKAATYIVREHDTGDKVRFVQWAVGVPVDGQFGPQTFYAVEQFQKYHGLHVDGVVGPQTLGALRQVTH